MSPPPRQVIAEHHPSRPAPQPGSANATQSLDLISIEEVAERLARSPRSIAAEALRRHEQIPVYVQPDPPGWRAVRYQADPRPRVSVFLETRPHAVYDEMLTDSIMLTPDVLRDVLAAGKLHRVTIDGEPVSASREEVGYAAWSIGAQGKVETDPESAIARSYVECFVLCEPQRVPLEALLVDEGALDLLRADASEAAPAPAADEGLDALREVRDILREVVHSDVVQGLLALRGRKTLVRLLLGVVPTHVAASMLPGAEKDAGLTLRRLGLISDELGNRGGAVVLDRLRRGLAGDDPKPTSSRLPGGTGARGGELKRSKLFD